MPGKILIIDHDSELAQAVSVYLERQQFTVTLAATCKEAQEIFERISPGIVIAEPYLPEADGVSLLRGFKKQRPQTLLIIITKEDRIEEAMTALRDNALNYMKKPVTSTALDLTLKQAMDWIFMQKKLNGYTQKLGKLHNAQVLYQQLFDEVPCYISVQDRHFRLTATNRLFKNDFGHEIGEYCYKVYKHREAPCPNCPVEATFDDGLPHQTEEVVTSKSGNQYNVLTWTAPIRNEANEITQVMEMATNITQIRQLQDHLTSLGLMLGSMSHSVKGMLTALDGGIYLLETGIIRKDRGQISRGFDQVCGMVERIRKMVLEILYFTKPRELQYRVLKIGDLVKAVTETIKPKAKSQGIKMNVTNPAPAKRIEVDPDCFQAALVNLLENAVDACLSDSSKTEHRIDLAVFTKAPDRICFEIRDNGLGIDRETREKMFTLFFSSKGSRGTGLGLFTANHVVRQHGGTITVESKVEKGSCFSISIPRRRTSKNRLAEIKDNQ